MGKRGTLTRSVLVMAMAGGGVVGVAVTPAHAAACTSAPCGRVENKSNSQMKYTLKLNSGEDRCRVWNYEGADRTVGCKQQSLNAGDSVGGYYQTGRKDVDAFTFPDTGYHVTFNGGKSQRYFVRGVWTKILDWHTATCYKPSTFKTPYCFVNIST